VVLLDAIVGGWQILELNRWSSAFPFSVIDSRGFTQNFLFNSNMVQTGPISSGLYMIAGIPYAFPDPGTVVAGVQITPDVPATLTPMRFAYLEKRAAAITFAVKATSELMLGSPKAGRSGRI
jgi:hypothetical protein